MENESIALKFYRDESKSSYGHIHCRCSTNSNEFQILLDSSQWKDIGNLMSIGEE